MDCEASLTFEMYPLIEKKLLVAVTSKELSSVATSDLQKLIKDIKT